MKTNNIWMEGRKSQSSENEIEMSLFQKAIRVTLKFLPTWKEEGRIILNKT